jgi:NAD(P)-dependent dehydrogenase (short-subunit alcohol dehydrogenase family)
MIRLDDRVALVTGAASGIGKATAELLASLGARVAGLDLEPCSTELALTGDVSSAADVERAVATVEERLGGLDVLVSNAGLWLAGRGDGPSPRLGEEAWQRTLDVNLKSVYLGARFAIPAMLRRGGGAIVNVASVAAIRVGVGASDAYTAAKGGVLAITRTLAVEHAPAIRVNAVVPGPIATPLGLGPAGSLEALGELVPLGRAGRPEEVAAMIVFLVSDAGSFCTGGAYLVDGGYTAA